MGTPSGRFQSGSDLDLAFPFANMFKNSRGFGPQNVTDFPSFNSDGMPIGALTQSSGNSQFFLPQSYSGQWVMGCVNWQGAIQFLGTNGNTLTITSTTGGTFTGSNVQLTGTNARTVFSFNTPPSQINLIFPAGATYAASGGQPWVYFCRIADEAAILAGGINGIVFNSDYVAKIQALNLKSFRLFGWMAVVGVNAATFNDAAGNGHRYMNPLSSLTWATGNYVSGAVGGAISGTDTYTLASYPDMPATASGVGGISGSVVTLASGSGFRAGQNITGGTIAAGTFLLPFGTNGTTGVGGAGTYTVNISQSVSGGTSITGGYVDGECVHGWVTNTNLTSTPNFNVGTRGAVQLVRQPVDVTFAGLGAGNDRIFANSISTFTYNAILNRWIVAGFGITYQVPVEVSIAFCNLLNINPWWCVPHLLTDQGVNDYIAKFSDPVTGLNPGLTLQVEWSNEPWNSFGQPQTGFTKQAATQLGLPTNDFNSYYALRVRQVMGNIQTQWAASGSKAFVECGIGGSLFETGGGPAAASVRFDGSKLNSTQSPNYTGPDYTGAGNRPRDKANFLYYAQYWSGSNFANFFNSTDVRQVAALTAADDYVSGDTTRRQRALDFVDWDMRQGTAQGADLSGGQTISGLVSGHYPSWETLANTYGLPIDCYEGACEGWYPALLGSNPNANGGLGNGTTWIGWENPATIYNGGTSYTTIGQTVIDSSDLNLYSNNTNPNLNHTPHNDGGVNWLPAGRSYAGKLKDLLVAYKQDVRFQRAYAFHLAQWKSFPHNRTPANSSMVSAIQWAMFPGDIYSNPNGNYAAATTFSNPVNGGRLGRF